MIIAISGVDCAGKSTHIELLRQHFISQGKKCAVFWYRPGYSDEMQKLKSILRKGVELSKSLHTTGLKQFLKVTKPDTSKETMTDSSKEMMAESGEIPKVPVSDKSKLRVPAPIWLTTALMDTAFQWAVKLRILSRKYDVVICDRYVEDAKLDLQFKYPNISWTDSLLKNLSAVFPKPDKTILLWLPIEEMVRRAEEKNEPFADDERTRKLRYRAYEFLTDEEDITVIDASGDIETTHQRILDAL